MNSIECNEAAEDLFTRPMYLQACCEQYEKICVFSGLLLLVQKAFILLRTCSAPDLVISRFIVEISLDFQVSC